MENRIRVRFAPSPTGYLHVGSLRTALYNYLYARKVGGDFILRIEDTDQTRYVEGAVENLISTLNQVDLGYDEGPEKESDFGPYYQSERTEIYRKYADELISKGAAYRCFCTSEDLQKMREQQIAEKKDTRYDGRCRNLTEADVNDRISSGIPHVIRLKVPTEGEIVFYDIVREKVTIPWEMVDDQVLIKSDGFPTYHLANVVDDHLMQISHVIRGEEWLSSVPKHLFMYQTLGWKPPKMAHLPLLLNPDKSKLSKRQGDVAVEDFLNKGFLPETLLNFVALLGWHTKGDRELFSLKELEKEFSLKRITKSGAVFDQEKLKWMNGHYLKHLDLQLIADRAKVYFADTEMDISDDLKYRKVIDFARERVTLLSEIPHQVEMFYQELNISKEDNEILQQDYARSIFNFWLKALEKKPDWQETEINQLINSTSEELGIKGKNLYFPLRIALYGSGHGPDIWTLYDILGKEEVLNRFQMAAGR
jgi:nondiscriminating glutamyl-tRNA synthetase